MLKNALKVIVIFALGSAMSLAADAKIVVMNYQAVLFNSDAASAATLELRQTLEPAQNQLNDIQQQIQTRQSQLETDKDILTEAEVIKYQQELQQLAADQANLSARMQQAQQQSRSAFIEHYQPTIRALVESYVQANNISLVLDAQAVLWNNGTPDISDTILAQFNDKYSDMAKAAASE